MTWFTIGLISLASMFTAFLSGVAGMGGGVLLLALMTFVVPFQALIPLHGTTQLISNSSRSYYLFKHINKTIVLFFCLGLPFGVLFATMIVKELSSNVLPLSFLAALIFYALFKPKKLPTLNIPIWSYIFVGFTSGILGMLVGAAGPFIAVFFLRKDLSKEEVVSTKAIIQMAVHTLKVPAFLHLGFNYEEHWVVISLLGLGSIVGTKLGVKVLKKIKKSQFQKIYRLALFAALIRIVNLVYVALS